jgi:NSS family neurotransmitter:Na+ symporter
VLSGRLGWSRAKATVWSLLALAVVGALAALSNSTIADFKLFGMTPFDLFDALTSKILMPLGGIMTCLFIGWVWKQPRFSEALSNGGTLANRQGLAALFLVTRWVSPLLILVVMLKGLGVF